MRKGFPLRNPFHVFLILAYFIVILESWIYAHSGKNALANIL